MLLTISLTAVMMAGLFLMFYSAVLDVCSVLLAWICTLF